MIWIRADANREIGTGHVMRCLSIAAALNKLGQQVCFLTADQGAAALLAAKGQAYRVLGSDYRRMEGELPILEKLFAERRRKGGFAEAGEAFRGSGSYQESEPGRGSGPCQESGPSRGSGLYQIGRASCRERVFITV